jgi:hypothetical protein
LALPIGATEPSLVGSWARSARRAVARSRRQPRDCRLRRCGYASPPAEPPTQHPRRLVNGYGKRRKKNAMPQGDKGQNSHLRVWGAGGTGGLGLDEAAWSVDIRRMAHSQRFGLARTASIRVFEQWLVRHRSPLLACWAAWHRSCAEQIGRKGASVFRMPRTPCNSLPC